METKVGVAFRVFKIGTPQCELQATGLSPNSQVTRREYNVGLVLVFPMNKYVKGLCVTGSYCLAKKKSFKMTNK